MSKFKSYPSGAGMTDKPAFQQPIVAVNVDWIMQNGNRAQRRRVAREMAKQKSRQGGR